jgi:hypothetical protein
MTTTGNEHLSPDSCHEEPADCDATSALITRRLKATRVRVRFPTHVVPDDWDRLSRLPRWIGDRSQPRFVLVSRHARSIVLTTHDGDLVYSVEVPPPASNHSWGLAITVFGIYAMSIEAIATVTRIGLLDIHRARVNFDIEREAQAAHVSFSGHVRADAPFGVLSDTSSTKSNDTLLHLMSAHARSKPARGENDEGRGAR